MATFGGHAQNISELEGFERIDCLTWPTRGPSEAWIEPTKNGWVWTCSIVKWKQNLSYDSEFTFLQPDWRFLCASSSQSLQSIHGCPWWHPSHESRPRSTTTIPWFQAERHDTLLFPDGKFPQANHETRDERTVKELLLSFKIGTAHTAQQAETFSSWI